MILKGLIQLVCMYYDLMKSVLFNWSAILKLDKHLNNLNIFFCSFLIEQ